MVSSFIFGIAFTVYVLVLTTEDNNLKKFRVSTATLITLVALFVKMSGE